MNNNENIVGERIKQLRKMLGFSQTKLGLELGVASNYIYAWESGRRKPGIKMINLLISLAEKQDIKIDAAYVRPDLDE